MAVWAFYWIMARWSERFVAEQLPQEVRQEPPSHESVTIHAGDMGSIPHVDR